MTTEGQKIKFILELIRRTAKSEIIWETTHSSKNLPSIVDLSYKTVLEDKIFRILKYKSNYASVDAYELASSYEQGKIFRLFKHKSDYKSVDAYELDNQELGWYEKIRLELVDENNNTLYEFPDDYSLITLYRVIQEKTSGIADIFEQILQKH